MPAPRSKRTSRPCAPSTRARSSTDTRIQVSRPRCVSAPESTPNLHSAEIDAAVLASRHTGAMPSTLETDPGRPGRSDGPEDTHPQSPRPLYADAIAAAAAGGHAIGQILSALAAQIDKSAIGRTLTLVRENTDALNRFAESFLQIASTISRGVQDIDLGRSCDFDRWIPDNLHGLRDLEAVFSLTRDEGVPLSWVPRTEIVALLIEADGPVSRRGVLEEYRDEILEDCESALTLSCREWATQCRRAITTLRLGLFEPAQSHASNIVDSIVLTLASSECRKRAVELAQRDFDDTPLVLAASYLTLRPLERALVSWRPGSETPPPAHFARHVTSHAVGQSRVFEPVYALVAVMLATSLTIQFEADWIARRGDPPEVAS